MKSHEYYVPKKRIFILGGGFAGVATARHLEQHCKRHSDVEITLVSQDNFVVTRPLLFELFGTIDGHISGKLIRQQKQRGGPFGWSSRSQENQRLIGKVWASQQNSCRPADSQIDCELCHTPPANQFWS